jgi:hypothetical protein
MIEEDHRSCRLWSSLSWVLLAASSNLFPSINLVTEDAIHISPERVEPVASLAFRSSEYLVPDSTEPPPSWTPSFGCRLTRTRYASFELGIAILIWSNGEKISDEQELTHNSIGVSRAWDRDSHLIELVRRFLIIKIWRDSLIGSNWSARTDRTP